MSSTAEKTIHAPDEGRRLGTRAGSHPFDLVEDTPNLAIPGRFENRFRKDATWNLVICCSIVWYKMGSYGQDTATGFVPQNEATN